MANSTNSLDGFGDAIKRISARNEEERIALNDKRGEPDWFVIDADQGNADLGMGVGYWVVEDHIVAFRRYANGYERYPCGQYERSMIMKFMELFEAKDKHAITR